MRRVAVVLAILFLALAPFQVSPVAAAPTLDLPPWRAACATPMTALGTESTPGSRLRFTVRPEDTPDTETAFTEVVVAADGTFTLAIDLLKLYPNCETAAAAAGLQYRFSARDAASNALLAYAIYAVSPDPGPMPMLALDPATGPCATADPQLGVRGANFPPGVTVRLDVRQGTGDPVTFPVGVVAADGTFTALIRVAGCGPATPLGTIFTVVAYSSDIPGAEPQTLLATATFTVGTPIDEELCFPMTGRCISGRFLTHWRATGGITINGYPLSDEIEETLTNAQGQPQVYTVQYFERVRLELHPEFAAPNDVQLGQLGRTILAGVPDAATARVPARDGAVYFTETGHNVDADIFAYWLSNGGLNQFGYPLTEEFVQRLENDQLYVVQYFERARIERHPENVPPYTILLGQFGRQICGDRCR